MGGNSPTTVCDRKLKSVGYHVAFFAFITLRLAVLVQCRLVLDRQTHDDG